MALLRRRIPGAPCAPYLEVEDACPVDDEGNLVEPSRMREAWLILLTGFARTVRTASEGVEAIKLQMQLYSAAIGTPGLKTPQYLMDKLLQLPPVRQPARDGPQGLAERDEHRRSRVRVEPL